MVDVVVVRRRRRPYRNPVCIFFSKFNKNGSLLIKFDYYYYCYNFFAAHPIRKHDQTNFCSAGRFIFMSFCCLKTQTIEFSKRKLNDFFFFGRNYANHSPSWENFNCGFYFYFQTLWDFFLSNGESIGTSSVCSVCSTTNG